MNKKFEDVIAEQGRLIYTAVGDSMFPLIKPRDLLVIEAVKEKPKIGDVPLYKRDSGQYVLHRIVGMSRGKYVMKGDNRTALEKGVADRQIIGVLKAIVRGGKTFAVETPDEFRKRNAADLITLLSRAVNEAPDGVREKPEIENMDMAEIFRLSREHMLTCAVSFALEKETPLPHDFDQAKKKAIRKSALFEIERTAIFREFEAAGIWYLPLKGIVLKDFYPKAAMREMTDNDILVDPSRTDRVREIMEKLGYSCDEYGEHNHDVYSKPPTLEFEIHRELFDREKSPLFADYFSDVYTKTVPNGNDYARRLSDEDFYVYVLSHTFKHYSHAGAGLRSLLDVYVFLRARPDLDAKYLSAELKKLGIVDFEEKMRRLSGKVFSGAPLDDREREELDYFISSGFGGTAENRDYNKMSEDLGNDDSKRSKLRYLTRRVFISGKELENHYPFVAKHKALYPLLVVYRPIKGALRRSKGILREYKNVRQFKKKENKK